MIVQCATFSKSPNYR